MNQNTGRGSAACQAPVKRRVCSTCVTLQANGSSISDIKIRKCGSSDERIDEMLVPKRPLPVTHIPWPTFETPPLLGFSEAEATGTDPSLSLPTFVQQKSLDGRFERFPVADPYIPCTMRVYARFLRSRPGGERLLLLSSRLTVLTEKGLDP